MLRSALTAVAFVALAIAILATPASATVTGTNPCPNQPTYSWMGDSVAAPVTIPSLTHPNGTSSYDGSIFRPANTSAYPGSRPLIVFAHGVNGAMCNLDWAAQDAAGHGYTAIVVTANAGDNTAQFVEGLDAQSSAIAFARSAANPDLAETDGDRVAVSGFSLGSIVASVDQQNAATDPAIKTVVAFDTLRRYVTGDKGGVDKQCLPPGMSEITPEVPALTFASDHPCGANKTYAPPDLKLSAFGHWRDAGFPVEQLVMRDYNHTDFATSGSETQLHDLSHYFEAWLSLYLGGNANAAHALVAESVNGRPTTDILSTTFQSGAFLPDLDVNTSDFSAYLAANAGPPETRHLKGPTGRITKKRIRHHHVRFRFSSTQEDVTFQCRLDGGAYSPCSSPYKIKRAGLGRHTLHVRATDPGGLTEARPAKSHFRVVKSRHHHGRDSRS